MISVCIATHNGEKYIEELLDSILAQLNVTDEVIIADDASNDNTLSIMRAYNDARLKIYQNEFKNPITNFEFVLDKAKGNYIFLADQDDVWDQKKVERVISYLNLGYDLVLTDAKIFADHTGNILHNSFFRFNRSKEGVINNLVKNSFIGCCMAFNQNVKRKVLPFPKQIPMHDSWIGLLAAIKFKVKYLQEPLVYYRKHDQNFSATSTGFSSNSFLKKIGFRFALISALIGRLIFKQ